MFITKLMHALRCRYFPNAQERVLLKWRADEGDTWLRFNYDLDKTPLAIDLGGYQGQWTSDLFARYCCRVIVFEPVRRYADKVKERFRHNDKILVQQYGLGGSSRTEMIGVCEEGSSTFRDSSEKEVIQILDVAEWFAREQVQAVDLLKINIEGSEYDLLERLVDTTLIRKIANIQVQFHDIQKDSAMRMENLQAKLRETHAATFQYRFVWESWTRKE